mmetsp:Transcript_4532/g.8063  ORF Transcript_4532/g.8063 Transcript_4532/m.8063 type:complete len:83 (-) Transcript_4532:31-279(-)
MVSSSLMEGKVKDPDLDKDLESKEPRRLQECSVLSRSGLSDPTDREAEEDNESIWCMVLAFIYIQCCVSRMYQYSSRSGLSG